MFIDPAAKFDFVHGGVAYTAFTLADLAQAEIPDEAALPAVKALFKQRIDTAAEDLRMSLLTPGSGQAMEYQEAQAQATAALKASASATADKYPMLAVSIGIDVDPSTGEKATDVLGVARSIDAARVLWLKAGAAIRGARLTAKAEIDAAPTIEAAQVAFAAVTIALPSST